MMQLDLFTPPTPSPPVYVEPEDTWISLGDAVHMAEEYEARQS